MANHGGNSASYIFKDENNGVEKLMNEINTWSGKYCEEMKTYPGGPKSWQKNLWQSKHRERSPLC